MKAKNKQKKMETQEKEFRKKLKEFQNLRNSIVHNVWDKNLKEEDSLAELLISLLSKHEYPENRSFSEELSKLSEFTSEIAEAVSENILTDSEAEALVKYMFSAFLSRRVNNVVNNLFAKPHSKWFLAAKHEFYEKQR